jgi:hypothetical protein
MITLNKTKTIRELVELI